MKIAILILTLSIGIYIVRAYKRSQAYLILQHYTKSPYEEKMELQRYVRKRNSHMPLYMDVWHAMVLLDRLPLCSGKMENY